MIHGTRRNVPQLKRLIVGVHNMKIKDYTELNPMDKFGVGHEAKENPYKVKFVRMDRDSIGTSIGYEGRKLDDPRWTNNPLD